MRKLHSLLALTLFLAGLSAMLPEPAAAQDYDPPGRVARLNYLQGSVSYQLAGDQNWQDANPNRPLTTGDNLWVDRDSRGEVHIGSTAIRLASETGISFLTLDDRTVQLQLAQGTIEVHLRNLSPDDAFEIDTPNLAFTLTRRGEYRIQTDPDGGSTIIVVREGEGEVTGGGDSWPLRQGQEYVFRGRDELSYDANREPNFDEFEDWCEQRDEHENRAQSARYVSRDVDGYYDLDDYGDWRSDPDYGNIWIPRGVAVGWAPYHFGHWVYIAPWGWTWVDEEPWGFAPFHYGRWVFVGGYWGWVPGPVVVRPVYAPALVGFVGGSGFSMSVSFGGGFSGVAWFPLGPRDVYVPGYRCSQRYVQNVNITNTRVVNVTQVTNVYNTVIVNRNTTVVNNYTYARNERAVTAVSRETFVNARPVSTASVRVTEQQIRNVRPVDSAPIAPVRASYVSSTAKPSQNRPVVPFEQRAVVARLNPTVSRPVQQQGQQRGNQNRPFGQQQNNQQANPQGGQGNQGNQGNQRGRFNQPNVQQQNVPPQGGTQQQGGAQVQSGNPPSGPQGGQGSQGNQRGRFNQPNVQQQNVPPQGGTQQQGGAQVQSGNPPQGNKQGQQQERQQSQPSGGFRPFTPPNSNNPPQSNDRNQNQNDKSSDRGRNDRGQQQQQQQQSSQQPNVRFTPPPKAHDENYDVHPPLNQRQNQEQAQPPAQPQPPAQEQRRVEPPPPNRGEQQHNDNKHQDNKKDDNKKDDNKH
jgi:uncharacterized protein DUF6600